MAETGDDVLVAFARTLGDAGIDFMVVGAFAVMAYGFSRFSDDIDFAVDLRFDDRDEIGQIFEDAGWPYEKKVDPVWGKRLMADHTTGMKIEVFFLPDHPLHQRELQRRRIVEYHGKEIPFISPEDLVLRKLVNTKHRRGHDFDDALSVIAVQGEDFDIDYVRDHCATHRVCDRFEQALKEARELEPE